MPITLFGTAKVPTSTDTSNPGPTSTLTPPASMVTNDYVIVVAHYKSAGVTHTVSNAGGQTWTSETQQSTPGESRVFHCRFNGTWSANPAFTVTAGTLAHTLYMQVWRGVDKITALDVAVGGAAYTAPGGSFDVTIPSFNTITPGAVACLYWLSDDDNQWTMQTAGWSQTEAYWRNFQGTDASISAAYKTVATPGATNDATNRQTLNGGDAGLYQFLALRPAAMQLSALGVG